jgi:hypothetical protein
VLEPEGHGGINLLHWQESRVLMGFTDGRVRVDQLSKEVDEDPEQLDQLGNFVQIK